jgi:AMP phosphorylase
MASTAQKYKVHFFDVEAGLNVAVLNGGEAHALNIETGDRIFLRAGKRNAIALADMSENYIPKGTIGLFADTADALRISEGDSVTLEKAQRPASLDYIRKKLDGGILEGREIHEIVSDLLRERFSVAELSAFVTGIYIRGLAPDEIVSLTNAMVASGEVMTFPKGSIVASEHSIGGVAGDRISMLIVPIIASLGIVIPKTASRAISSASGTADAMEVLADVNIPRQKVEQIAQKVGGALVWGGGVNIAVADDRLISVRHPLRLDPPGLLLSSILAKKKAEGAKFVLLDIPVGKGCKIENVREAEELAKNFKFLSKKLGMELNCIITNGSEPIMNAIGPALEARAVLETLHDGGRSYPHLTEKAVELSSVIAGMALGISKSKAHALCKKSLESGKAEKKFREIIAAQGGDPSVRASQISPGRERRKVLSKVDGKVGHVDNKAIFRLCRALGAPSDKKAGIMLFVRKEKRISKGDVLFEMYSSSRNAIEYAHANIDEYPVVEIEKVIIDII